METYTEIAKRIKNAEVWDEDDCKALCEAAGMSEEWDTANGETFEAVVKAAADKLHVEIY